MKFLRGHCTDCGQMYPANQVEDGLCARCRALQPKNEPGMCQDDFDQPSRYSKGAIRERLGVSWNEDI